MDDYVPEAVLNDLFEKACGLPGFEAAESATSVDLRSHEDWSAVALPIALWPVGRRVRGALLSGELFLACVMRPNVWHDAMRAEGLELVEEGRAWKVQGPTSTGRLDPLEVGKLRLGVAFSGVSPREIAAGLAASLKNQPS